MTVTETADPVGLTLTSPELMTPAFVIDDAKLSANIARAKGRAAALGVTYRPHLKTHKSIGIARRQMMTPEGPATVSTLAEARYFASHGVKDILYAVGIAPQKLSVVKAIRDSGCDLKIILDNVAAAVAVSDFCRREKTEIPVLLEVDVDGHRSGIKPESDLLLKTAAALTDGATLAGVLTHADRLRNAEYEVSIVSVGSSPTLMFSESESGVTEIRAGVCALFDLFMTNLGVCTLDDIAGSVVTTVIGHQDEKHQVICDAGFLAMSRDRGTQRQKHDYGYGLVCDIAGKPLDGGRILLTGTNQEHGIITLPADTLLKLSDFPVGTRLRILPNHACPTAAPYEKLLLVNGEGRITEALDHVRGW